MPRNADWKRHQATELDPGRRTGVLLLGMGGPDRTQAVEPFLRNLFRDPAVLPLPAPLAFLVGEIIVRKRRHEVRERYLSLGFGGASPQLDWTRRQAEELRRRLGARDVDALVEPAMRYWHPFAGESVAKLIAAGAEQFIVLPTYPQFAEATSGSSLADACRSIQTSAPGAPLRAVADWHLLPGYLDALVAAPSKVLGQWAQAGEAPERCALLFAAHSLPERFERRGDPYVGQTRASVEAVHGRLALRLEGQRDWLRGVAGGAEALLAFQSRVGPVRWVGPDLVAEVERLAQAGCRHLMVQPVSFSCEHIETLHELDQELAATAKGHGVERFMRGPALNLDAGWLDSLAGLLLHEVFGLESKEARHAV